MAEELQISYKEGTDVGKVRDHNEDCVLVPKVSEADHKRKGRLFIVADGMGGYQAGEVASEIAARTVARVYYEDPSEDTTTRLSNAVQAANAEVHQQAQSNTARAGMGTTMVAVALVGRTAYVASVGDSRAYVAHKGELNQITHDHSFVGEQVRAGILTKEQARTHPQRNVITRALGSQPTVQVDTFSGELSDGDVLVMCTDGLTGHVPDDKLRDTVLSLPPKQAVPQLIQMAKDDGGSDNITLIVLRVGPPAGGKAVASSQVSTVVSPAPAAGAQPKLAAKAKPAQKSDSHLAWIIGGVVLALGIIVVLGASVVAFDLLGTRPKVTPSVAPTLPLVVPIVTTVGGAPIVTPTTVPAVATATLILTNTPPPTNTPRPVVRTPIPVLPSETPTPEATLTPPQATETPKPDKVPRGGNEPPPPKP
jgi:serine/threonine protein phosphatase PrpC